LQIMTGANPHPRSANARVRVSPTKNSHPSAYLQDVVAFLTTVVRTALQNLPQNIKTFVYFDALDHLATSLKVVFPRFNQLC
jgi:hypothetical protein